VSVDKVHACASLAKATARVPSMTRWKLQRMRHPIPFFEIEIPSTELIDGIHFNAGLGWDAAMWCFKFGS
jgi:hypothetical protein